MMTTIRASGMFKYAVGYAGICDLAMMYKKGDIKESKSGRSYLNTVIGKDDADLAANSPDKLADKIDVPVLLVHGEADQRAPFPFAQAMHAALGCRIHVPRVAEQAGRRPWLLRREKQRGVLHFLLQTFIAKHIGAGGTTP